jgi:hypothetical protein
VRNESLEGKLQSILAGSCVRHHADVSFFGGLAGKTPSIKDDEPPPGNLLIF